MTLLLHEVVVNQDPLYFGPQRAEADKKTPDLNRGQVRIFTNGVFDLGAGDRQRLGPLLVGDDLDLQQFNQPSAARLAGDDDSKGDPPPPGLAVARRGDFVDQEHVQASSSS